MHSVCKSHSGLEIIGEKWSPEERREGVEGGGGVVFFFFFGTLTTSTIVFLKVTIFSQLNPPIPSQF